MVADVGGGAGQVPHAHQRGPGARTDEIATIVSEEVGMPKMLSQLIQAGLPQGSFAVNAQLVEGFQFEEQVGNSLVVREPVGVVGCITPWNYPLHQIAAKVAPALAAGCTVVLKPSEVAPLNAFILAEIIDEVGLPAGRVQPRDRRRPGGRRGDRRRTPTSTWCRSPARPAPASACSRARRADGQAGALELGGKSANVILDDADFEKAVADGVGKCYLNSGQTCSALTRMLVPRTPRRGRGASPRRRPRRSRRAIPSQTTTPARAAGLGRRSATGCAATSRRASTRAPRSSPAAPTPPRASTRASSCKPTVFSDVRRDMTIAQEEIFGPVLSIMPYDDEDEAVRIANDTVYGLAGGVWAGDPERAKAVARQHPHRPGRGQRRRLQPHGAVRWLQAVGPRPRARQVRPRGVPRGQVPPALARRRCSR